VPAMKPGQTSSPGLVDVQNNGTVPMTVQLAVADLVDTPASPALSSALNFKIQQCESTTTCTAPTDLHVTAALRSFPGPLTVGTIPAGAKRRYVMTLAWPSANTNPSLQGATSTLKFRWTASSTANAS